MAVGCDYCDAVPFCYCANTDYCGCPKDSDCWGSFGWHWKPTPDWPKGQARMGPGWGIAYERCPRYDAKKREQ